MSNSKPETPPSEHPLPAQPGAGSTFADLDLPGPLLQALDGLGYSTPSPIQRQAIPILQEGLDLLGHAPTGTGKTAAFALPLLSRVDCQRKQVQILTLAPTRELALQVAEAFKGYSRHLPGLQVLPIYGGQDYRPQLQSLRSGVQVVVGTPGRVMDHIRRGTLKLDGLQAVVLDEADEMLRMGFVDEVQWILEQTPADRQMALFSATMPKAILQIAHKHMHDPKEISIKAKTATAETIRQRYWSVRGMHKAEALSRLLEVEDTDGVLIFVRTKSSTTELANRLEERGYAVAAMNGDMPQSQREQTVARLKRGTLDILVATDVAARGLDVDRISHVVNYDIPHDVESYIHRIGRTGRAGRKGEALLFVAPRERRMLGSIERATRQKIAPLELPSVDDINRKRIEGFKANISRTVAEQDLSFMRDIVQQYQQEQDVPAQEVAAALAQIVVGDSPLLLAKEFRREQPSTQDAGGRGEHRPKRLRSQGDDGFDQYRLEVGAVHGAKIGNIVGAIANEVGIAARSIGRVEVMDDCSFVGLPTGMPPEVFRELKNVWVCGQKLDLSLVSQGKAKGDRSGKQGKKRGKKASNAASSPTAGKKFTKKSDKKSDKKFAKKPGKKSSKKADKKAGKKAGKKNAKFAGAAKPPVSKSS